ncbi:uncharacterized protein LOC106174899 [Lingula anatina]|uniref:Uncharacterized protein LOC106174899 n=1 Tax=Lingula anatina TaxID=7574 RepID=A0A1S3JP46_LINAN|nr:uncharacterized protein LOC106174899 [Lingula anatina]XP_013412123.1 uncharacterized protein LOC106174899 [Lingula anatina]|eukprot:XP_013412122.1 uncharacterized protein LOC106174899 [Lingula anatina]
MTFRIGIAVFLVTCVAFLEAKSVSGRNAVGYYGGVRDAPYFPDFNPLEYCQYGGDGDKKGYGGKDNRVHYYYNPEDPFCSFVQCSNGKPVVIDCAPHTFNTLVSLDGYEFQYDNLLCDGDARSDAHAPQCGRQYH